MIELLPLPEAPTKATVEHSAQSASPCLLAQGVAQSEPQGGPQSELQGEEESKGGDSNDADAKDHDNRHADQRPLVTAFLLFQISVWWTHDPLPFAGFGLCRATPRRAGFTGT